MSVVKKVKWVWGACRELSMLKDPQAKGNLNSVQDLKAGQRGQSQSERGGEGRRDS